MRTNEQDWIKEIAKTVIVDLCRQINRELKPINDRLAALEHRLDIAKPQRTHVEASERR